MFIPLRMPPGTIRRAQRLDSSPVSRPAGAITPVDAPDRERLPAPTASANDEPGCEFDATTEPWHLEALRRGAPWSTASSTLVALAPIGGPRTPLRDIAIAQDEPGWQVRSLSQPAAMQGLRRAAPETPGPEVNKLELARLFEPSTSRYAQPWGRRERRTSRNRERTCRRSGSRAAPSPPDGTGRDRREATGVAFREYRPPTANASRCERDAATLRSAGRTRRSLARARLAARRRDRRAADRRPRAHPRPHRDRQDRPRRAFAHCAMRSSGRARPA